MLKRPLTRSPLGNTRDSVRTACLVHRLVLLFTQAFVILLAQPDGHIFQVCVAGDTAPPVPQLLSDPRPSRSFADSELLKMFYSQCLKAEGWYISKWDPTEGVVGILESCKDCQCDDPATDPFGRTVPMLATLTRVTTGGDGFKWDAASRDIVDKFQSALLRVYAVGEPPSYPALAVTDNDGRSVLHHAVASGSKSLLQKFVTVISKDVLGFRDISGKSALELAATQRSPLLRTLASLASATDLVQALPYYLGGQWDRPACVLDPFLDRVFSEVDVESLETALGELQLRSAGSALAVVRLMRRLEARQDFHERAAV
jgi:hypothetical protein